MSWADILFNKMMTGDFFNAILLSYTNVLNNFFYLIFFALGMYMIYQKTHNFGNIAVVGILMSSTIAVIIPSVAFTAILTTIILGVALILYRVFR